MLYLVLGIRSCPVPVLDSSDGNHWLSGNTLSSRRNDGDHGFQGNL